MHSRRSVLTTSVVFVLGVAGCSGTSLRADNERTDGSDGASEETETLLTVSDGEEEVRLLTYADVATVGTVEATDGCRVKAV